ncbi:hypothetical protein [Armatimonas sp.]|uniref:hypothetical protein n=1 Tax=Armatimonas sp. TaxID=1872638 RepID=UPI003750632E
MQKLLQRARKVFTPKKNTFVNLAWQSDSRLIGLEASAPKSAKDKPAVAFFSVDVLTGRRTTSPNRLPFLAIDFVGGTELVFSPESAALLGITDDDTGFVVHILSTDGQRHHTWELEKPLLSISERLHHASPPFWSDHGRAWVVLAFRHKGEEPTSELFAVTGRRDEPGKFRIVSLGRSDKSEIGCFHPDAFQGQYGFVNFNLGAILECTDGDTVLGARGTLQIGYRPQLFRYTFRLSEGARSRTATIIPFPTVGSFNQLAYSPVSKRLAVFVAQDYRKDTSLLQQGYELHTLRLDGSQRVALGELAFPYTGPFPRQLQWLPGGRKLCFEFKGAFYVVDGV